MSLEGKLSGILELDVMMKQYDATARRNCLQQGAFETPGRNGSEIVEEFGDHDQIERAGRHSARQRCLGDPHATVFRGPPPRFTHGRG